MVAMESSNGCDQAARHSMLAFAEIFYLHGHKAMYDAETLEYIMTAAGFTNVVERPFGESAISPAPDSAFRRDETVYVEGTR